MIDILGNKVTVGTHVVCLPHTNFIMLFCAEIIELQKQGAVVKFNYPKDIFDGREETTTCYYENMVIIQ